MGGNPFYLRGVWRMHEIRFNGAPMGPLSKRLREYRPLNQNRKVEEPKLKILRIIAQRPYFTGSGINFINLAKQTREHGIEQYLIFGQPDDQDFPLQSIVGKDHTSWVTFQGQGGSVGADLPFPVAGMSDQMPYRSTKFSDFTAPMLESYLAAFEAKIREAVVSFRPNVIHSHHLWLVTALSRVLLPELPMVATCHNTALRQMKLAPQLKPIVAATIRDMDAIAVQTTNQIQRIRSLYKFSDLPLPAPKFHVVGQGINTDLFYSRKRKAKEGTENSDRRSLIYVGKLSYSKGVLQLLEAFKEVIREVPYECHLYLAGSGEGPEKEMIIREAQQHPDRIHLLGQLSQEDLAAYFRKCDIFVLPSFYDSLPKVLFESLACGCRAIITDLPGIRESVEAGLGAFSAVSFIPRPKMRTIDEPEQSALPQFVHELKERIKAQLTPHDKQDLSEKVKKEYGKKGLFRKYLTIYRSFLKTS